MTAAEIRRWARDVKRFADDMPGDAIVVVEDAIAAQLRADTGDGALSRGRKLGRASTRVTRRKREAIVEASGSRAVWGILQGGSTAHAIVARRRPLNTPYGPRMRVSHPGARAKHTYTRGAERGLDAAAREIERRWARVGR